MNPEAVFRKGQSRLYFFRKLRSFNVGSMMLHIFCAKDWSALEPLELVVAGRIIDNIMDNTLHPYDLRVRVTGQTAECF